METPTGHVPGLTLRRLHAGDYHAVISLWREAGLSHRPEGRDRYESLQAELTRGSSVFLVAEMDGALVGTALGTHDGRKGWINRVAVAPALRRQGLAGLLVARLETWLESEGIEIVACLVESGNCASLALFKKLDYVVDRDILYLSKRKNVEV